MYSEQSIGQRKAGGQGSGIWSEQLGHFSVLPGAVYLINQFKPLPLTTGCEYGKSCEVRYV